MDHEIQAGLKFVSDRGDSPKNEGLLLAVPIILASVRLHQNWGAPFILSRKCCLRGGRLGNLHPSKTSRNNGCWGCFRDFNLWGPSFPENKQGAPGL